MVVNIFLTLLAVYAGIGVLFALYFLISGAGRIDPLMKDTRKPVRLLLFPGVAATWPFLLGNLIKKKG